MEKTNGETNILFIIWISFFFFCMDCPPQPLCSKQLVVIVSLLLSNLLQLRAMAMPWIRKCNNYFHSAKEKKKKSIITSLCHRRAHTRRASERCWLAGLSMPNIGSVNDDWWMNSAKNRLRQHYFDRQSSDACLRCASASLILDSLLIVLFSLAQSCRRLVRVCRHGHVQLPNVNTRKKIYASGVWPWRSLFSFCSIRSTACHFVQYCCLIALGYQGERRRRRKWRVKGIRVESCALPPAHWQSNANSIQNEIEFNSNARCIETNAVHSENRSSNKSSVNEAKRSKYVRSALFKYTYCIY